MLPAVRLVVVLVVSAILEGCGSATTSVPSLPGPQVAAHAVGVRVVGAEGEFYNRLTGAPFTPRGNNNLRLAYQLLPSGERDLYHSTFNIGLYNPSQIEQALSQMQSSGYNVVRVWLNGCCLGTIGNPAGGLSNECLANVVDLLVRARAHNLLVVLTTDSVPAFGGYAQVLSASCCSVFAGTSLDYLTPGGIAANKQFWRDLVQAFMAQKAPLDAIFAYELRNKLFFQPGLPPLSLASGLVTTANGRAYDMAAGSKTAHDERKHGLLQRSGARANPGIGSHRLGDRRLFGTATAQARSVFASRA